MYCTCVGMKDYNIIYFTRLPSSHGLIQNDYSIYYYLSLFIFFFFSYNYDYVV